MVNFDLEIKKAQPINIREMELKKHGINDNIKKSIILYNMAIGDIRKGKLELAINDLKKSLSYNKEFSDALKLKGLCHVNMKEYKKGEKIFKKLSKDLIYNELANEYIQSLITQKLIAKNNVIDIDEIKYIPNNDLKKSTSAKRSTGSIVIGLLIIMTIITGAGASRFYSYNIQGILGKIHGSFQDVLEKVQGNNNKAIDSEEETDRLLDESEGLDKENITYEENKSVPQEIEASKVEADKNKSNEDIINKLNDTEKAFKDGNYEKAASNLISMKSINIDNESKKKFDKLWKDLNPNVLWDIYNQGNKLYKQKKYSEALPKLIIASEIDPNLYLMPWITYQIGTCYKETNDKVNALIYFKKVKENYPKSNYVSNAEMMINEIGN
ncbi:tetratricopeptide repeat protein [Clostridium chromiireducens]|uniref:Tetratricopeptide repeat protein n=1 Tax=Clostridium chromiireducens TaxID=225345 RepID=A0A964W1V8_9CLOT|nr:tetratricopeptide repeat protein [Clostridium chromiireducens]MVX63458.1 tetratricopeptide repeat protein [Clostridium chromiireducens]